jgi:hypothetical protein
MLKINVNLKMIIKCKFYIYKNTGILPINQNLLQ